MNKRAARQELAQQRAAEREQDIAEARRRYAESLILRYERELTQDSSEDE